MTDHRSAITGQYVTAKFTQAEPETTVSEQRNRRPVSDYSELRARAEACPPEDTNSRWYSEDQLARGDELAAVIVDEDRPFVAACSPTVVLGLLDELDRLRGVVHAQRVALDGDDDANSNSKAQLGVGLEPIAFDPPLTDDEAGAFLDAIMTDEADR